MKKNERRVRPQRKRDAFTRTHELGYYTVITDAKHTEKNYLSGLRQSLPLEMQKNLVIKVIDSIPSNEFMKKIKEIQSKEVTYGQLWIVFDRDQISKFDKIIYEVEDKQKDMRIGWSNPCIEIWFHAYFGEMPSSSGSRECNALFCREFEHKTKQKYRKNDNNIYRKLNQYGDENHAIKLAETRHKGQPKGAKPSEMLSTSTLYCLIDEIRSKVKAKE